MSPQYFDVIIVGAGLSGICAAYYLQKNCPDQSYVILEGRDSLGGTWDLFRYPGVRSDSVMYTLGYSFKPWRHKKAIADGESILQYIGETARENNIDQQIRYGHFVKKAAWRSEDSLWTISAEPKKTGETVDFSCNFLLLCSGYYSYESGYTPEFKERDRFVGKIIHPQQWPENLDYRDKRAIVIGSGATAITLVPALAKDAAHVVMLQRSPTYVVSLPEEDVLANFLYKLFPEQIANRLIRWKYTTLQKKFYHLTRVQPEKIKQKLLERVRQELGADYDVETHFTPDYNPWDQRLCVAPNSDLFKAIKSGKASVVTDQIDCFTEKGILLKSGQELIADIIITATGLTLVNFGGIDFRVDDRSIEFSQTYTYKGLMFANIPNLIYTFGYVNASWTLRAELTFEYMCKLINYMRQMNFKQCTPRLRPEDDHMPLRPWLENFSSGYIQRNLDLFPRQGDREPWLNPQNYQRDQKMLRQTKLEDGVLRFN